MIFSPVPVPPAWTHAVHGWLGRRAILSVPSLRRRIEDNLTLIWPDMPAPERARLTRAIASASGRNLLGLIDNRWLIANAADRIRLVDGPGLEALLAAHASGQGALVLGSHHSRFDVGRIAMKARGVEVAALYRPQNNALADRLQVAAMRRAGEPLFPRGPKGMRGAVRHLRSGGIVAMLIDQKIRTGVPLPFLGRPALTSTDPAAMALRLGVPVFIAHARSVGIERFEMRVEGPVAPTDPETMTRAYNASLSALIERDPTEWHWLHRRWADAPDPP